MSRTAGNVGFFLDMIATSELGGLMKVPEADEGYRVIVGSHLDIYKNGHLHSPQKLILMTHYEDHPRQVVEVREGLRSTAAGRYQLLARFYDYYKRKLALTGFTPEDQDAIAIQQIRECGAYGYAERGDLDYAIPKVAHIWASLPGANYGQHEQTHSFLVAAFVAAGGKVV